jgi:hypothetical protein
MNVQLESSIKPDSIHGFDVYIQLYVRYRPNFFCTPSSPNYKQKLIHLDEVSKLIL